MTSNSEEHSAVITPDLCGPLRTMEIDSAAGEEEGTGLSTQIEQQLTATKGTYKPPSITLTSNVTLLKIERDIR
jgi:hypothetical protein